MSQDSDSRRKLITAAASKIMDEALKSIQDFQEFETPKLRDDYDKLHARMLFMSDLEKDFSHLYRRATELRHEVEVSRARAKEFLEDAKMEVVNKANFKNPANAYQSKAETDGKIRALTFEAQYELRNWEELYIDMQYLIDVMRSMQNDAYKQRRDIDTRLKIFSLQL